MHDYFISPSASGLARYVAGSSVSWYNTADQDVNYERVRAVWTGSVFQIVSEQGGTGTRRAVQISSLAVLTLYNGNQGPAVGVANINLSSSTATATVLGVTASFSAASGVQYGMSVAPTLNQSGTAGYTALLVNPTETATGSGVKNLIDAQVGGTSKFTINDAGNTFVNGTIDLGHASDTTISRTASGQIAVETIPVVLRTIQTVTSTVTIGAVGDFIVFIGASGAPTLPTAVGNTGKYTFKNIHTANRTVSTTSSQTIETLTTYTLPANASIDVVSDGANWRII